MARSERKRENKAAGIREEGRKGSAVDDIHTAQPGCKVHGFVNLDFVQRKLTLQAG